MKLVRDKIPDIIKEDGRECKHHVANYDEYKTHLYEKMREELDEFIDTPCEEEAADMYEVLRAICLLHTFPMEVVESVAAKKRVQRGAFNDWIILEEVNESR